MSEAIGGDESEQRNRHQAAEMIGYPAFLTRKQRFDERVQQVENGIEREDAYFYTSEELIEAYEIAEQMGQAVIEACMQYRESINRITNIRRQLQQEHEAEEKHRNIGSDVLNIVEIEAPVDCEADVQLKSHAS